MPAEQAGRRCRLTGTNCAKCHGLIQLLALTFDKVDQATRHTVLIRCMTLPGVTEILRYTILHVLIRLFCCGDLIDLIGLLLVHFREVMLDTTKT